MNVFGIEAGSSGKGENENGKCVDTSCLRGFGEHVWRGKAGGGVGQDEQDVGSRGLMVVGGCISFLRQNGLGPVRGAAGAVFLWSGMKGGPNGGDLFMAASRRLRPAVVLVCWNGC